MNSEKHSELSHIMELQSLGDYTTPDYPFVMTYVDDDELVVMMHGMAVLVGVQYEEEEIQVALDTDIPIEIIYGEFVLETSQSRINSWKQYYIDHCSPVQAGYQTVCTLYGDRLRAEGINPDSLVPTPVIVPPTPALSSSSPCDESSSSLACYYYTRYIDRCLPTHTTFRCNTYATQITTSGYTLPTSSGTITPIVPTTLVEKNPTNVVAALNGDIITVTWTAPSHDVEKYKVYPYEDNRRQSKTYVTAESFTFTDTEEGKYYKFKVRAYYEERQNGRISSSYVYSNVVSVPDSVPDPVIPEIVLPVCGDSSSTTGLFCDEYQRRSSIVQGGEPVWVVNRIGSNTNTIYGTIGFVTENSLNQTIAISNSHVLSNVGITERVYQKDSLNNTKTIGILGTAGGTQGIVTADAAYVILNSQANHSVNKIQYNGTLLDVTGFGGINNLPVGTSLKMAGTYNDSIGGLQYHNVTVSGSYTELGEIHRYTLINQMSGSYNGQGGDSGAPVFNDNNGVVLLGIHNGQTCQITLESGQSMGFFQNGICPNGSYVYKIFPSWESVVNILGLN